jgi:hypothetical protein
MLQQESHKGRLETSDKMPARNPADKVHYIVQGLATYPFSHFGTGRSQTGLGRANSIIDACWHSSLFQGLSERESSTSRKRIEYFLVVNI